LNTGVASKLHKEEPDDEAVCALNTGVASKLHAGEEKYQRRGGKGRDVETNRQA
jgi:hypothetical protein